jgi:hypothetical protein
MGRPTVIAGNASAFGPEPDEPTRELEPAHDDDAAPGSVLAQLRARAEAQRQARTLELPVGGAFGENLVIRYRVLERREWDKYAVLLTPAVTAGGDTGDLPPMSVLNARMMAAACETVLWLDGDERHDLEVRLDGRLAEMLGHPLPPGTSYDDLGVLEVVEGLFPSPMAVTAHAGELVRWMQDPSNPGGAEGET